MEVFDLPYDCSVASDAEIKLIHEKMFYYNKNQLSLEGVTEVAKNYIVKDNDHIIAGIKSSLYFGECFCVDIIFVDEQYRHQHIGSALLKKIEHEAKELGAKLIHLETFDFQAKDFYLKAGYEIFGVLENCPGTHTRYYLKKQL